MMLAIAAAPIEFRTIQCGLRDESDPSVRVAKRALHGTTFSASRGLHCTFRNSIVITVNKADSIRTRLVRATTAMDGDSEAILGCNVRASASSGHAVSANTTARTASRKTDDLCHKVSNQRIKGCPALLVGRRR